MKWLALSVVALQLFAPQVFADRKGSVPPQGLLKYHDLYYLPTQKRVSYLRDVRQALAEFERAINKSEKMDSKSSAWRAEAEKLLAMMTIIDRAEAATKCPAGSTLVQIYRTDKSLCGFETKGPCGGGYVEYRQPGGKSYCFEAKAYEAAIRRKIQQREKVEVVQPVRSLGDDESAVRVANPAGKSGHQAAQPPTQIDQQGEVQAETQTVASASGCKNRDETRAAFYATKVKDCLMGGNFSEYRGGKIKVGNCQPVSSFPSHKSPKVDEQTVSCPSAQNICNPILYCGEKDGDNLKPFCQSITQDLTRGCEAIAKAKAPDCDPFAAKWKNVLPVLDEWNKFKEKFDSLCKEGTEFANYFCEECGLMRTRVSRAAGQAGASSAQPPVKEVPKKITEGATTST